MEIIYNVKDLKQTDFLCIVRFTLIVKERKIQ